MPTKSIMDYGVNNGRLRRDDLRPIGRPEPIQWSEAVLRYDRNGKPFSRFYTGPKSDNNYDDVYHDGMTPLSGRASPVAHPGADPQVIYPNAGDFTRGVLTGRPATKEQRDIAASNPSPRTGPLSAEERRYIEYSSPAAHFSVPPERMSPPDTAGVNPMSDGSLNVPIAARRINAKNADIRAAREERMRNFYEQQGLSNAKYQQHGMQFGFPGEYGGVLNSYMSPQQNLLREQADAIKAGYIPETDQGNVLAGMERQIHVPIAPDPRDQYNPSINPPKRDYTGMTVAEPYTTPSGITIHGHRRNLNTQSPVDDYNTDNPGPITPLTEDQVKSGRDGLIGTLPRGGQVWTINGRKTVFGKNAAPSLTPDGQVYYPPRQFDKVDSFGNPIRDENGSVVKDSYPRAETFRERQEEASKKSLRDFTENMLSQKGYEPSSSGLNQYRGDKATERAIAEQQRKERSQFIRNKNMGIQNFAPSQTGFFGDSPVLNRQIGMRGGLGQYGGQPGVAPAISPVDTQNPDTVGKFLNPEVDAAGNPVKESPFGFNLKSTPQDVVNGLGASIGRFDRRGKKMALDDAAAFVHTKQFAGLPKEEQDAFIAYVNELAKGNYNAEPPQLGQQQEEQPAVGPGAYLDSWINKYPILNWHPIGASRNLIKWATGY